MGSNYSTVAVLALVLPGLSRTPSTGRTLASTAASRIQSVLALTSSWKLGCCDGFSGLRCRRPLRNDCSVMTDIRRGLLEAERYQ
ncbi:uncharacterized protein B0H64DRAFT_406602 [Chaetomium fimeti]|uniref:Uncharacterized protein n=1 Tax=Chaetomium fimeti TaxID=1854472 RepID=A0AAE0LP78_9PEZI|nr:hypothetical protein B0H64DRAFT_406602 [Chaetomium fimeti]